MGYVVDRRYVPGHFVGHGQFQHWERPHWAGAGGGWVAPPPQHPVTGGFSQVHPHPVTGGFVRAPSPARNAVLQAMARATPSAAPSYLPQFNSGGGGGGSLAELILGSLLSGAPNGTVPGPARFV